MLWQNLLFFACLRLIHLEVYSQH